MAAGLYDPYGVKEIKRGDSSVAGPRQRGGDPSNPFRGGLMTDFNWLKNVQTTNRSGDYDYRYANRALTNAGQMDRDVQGAMASYNELIHPIAGTNGAEQGALFNMYLGRINQRNALAEQIANAEGKGKQDTMSSIYGEATRALGQGLKKTTENYNSRGLLYSGLREGGEQKVRAGVGAKLSSDIAGTNREMANVAAKAKQAYAAIGQANQQQMIDLANQTFETASRNNVARLQAYQQFGGGIGAMAGTIFGNMSKPSGNVVDTGETQTQGGAGGRPGLIGGVGTGYGY